MPYEIKERDGEFDLVNSDTGHVRATLVTKEAAESKRDLCHAMEAELDRKDGE